MTGVGKSNYNVGGYKPGDKISVGVVIDPAEITKSIEVKSVKVDLDLDGKFDVTKDDQLLVKLPPKGIKMANLDGLANESLKKVNMVKGLPGAIATGAALGGTVATFVMAPKLEAAFTEGFLDAAGAGLAVGGIGGFIGGGVTGGVTENAGLGVRTGLTILGLGLSIGTMANAAGVAGTLKVIGIGMGIGGAAGAGLQIFKNSQDINRAMEKARADMIPDMVKPKMILNLPE